MQSSLWNCINKDKNYINVIASEVNSMIINGKEYIKVRDAQEGETGWAYIEDGKVILDNEFERIPCGSTLILAEDEYTIANFAPNPVQAMITEMESDMAKAKRVELADLHDLVGRKVKSNLGTGIIKDVDDSSLRAVIEFDDNTTKQWNLKTIKDKLIR